jgi:hypothetical protein
MEAVQGDLLPVSLIDKIPPLVHTDFTWNEPYISFYSLLHWSREITG